MKVLDVTDFYSDRGGGIRSHLTAKAHHLARMGIEHVVVAPGAEDCRTEISPDSSGYAGARVIRVKGLRQPYDPNYHVLSPFGRARGLLANEQPDVLELNSSYFAALSVLSLPRQSYGVLTWLWHSDHVDTLLRPRLETRCGKRVASVLVRPLWGLLAGLASRCEAVFVASPGQAEKLRGAGFPRVVVVPFGVDKERFTPEARSSAMRRELLSAEPPDALLLVALGRLSPEKHWEVVLEAFFRLRQTRRAVLVFLGEGPQRKELITQARGRDDVKFLGFESNPARLASALASADALVHACPYETFGLGVAEAIAAGLPVVVPDQGGAAEHGNGPSTEKYPALSAEGCSAALQRLLERDADTVKQAALLAAERIPTQRAHFAGTLAVYEELLARKKRATERSARC